MYVTVQDPAQVTSYTYSTALTNIALTFCGQDLITYDSAYWSLIQPFETKIIMPSRNFYMYSFNGPVNFSRIADIQLTLTSSTGPLNLVVYTKTLNVFVAENGLWKFCVCIVDDHCPAVGQYPRHVREDNSRVPGDDLYARRLPEERPVHQPGHHHAIS
jgi:hypothetical protein